MHPCISQSSEVVSLKSEEKSDEKKKDKNLTNPTSETSSIKCSSIASHHDKVAPAIADTPAHNYNDEAEWITSANKKRNPKNKKNVKGNKNKKVKQNKNKAKQVKKQPQNATTGEVIPTPGMNKNIEQPVLSAASSESQISKVLENQDLPLKTETSPEIRAKEVIAGKDLEKSNGKLRNFQTNRVF